MLNGKDTWKGTSLSPGPLNLGLTKCQAALLGDWLLYTGIPKTMFCLRAEQGTRDGAALSTSAPGTWLCWQPSSIAHIGSMSWLLVCLICKGTEWLFVPF